MAGLCQHDRHRVMTVFQKSGHCHSISWNLVSNCIISPKIIMHAACVSIPSTNLQSVYFTILLAGRLCVHSEHKPSICVFHYITCFSCYVLFNPFLEYCTFSFIQKDLVNKAPISVGLFVELVLLHTPMTLYLLIGKIKLIDSR